MTSIGFIGLGLMGGPMAANLVKAGFDVTGFNRSPAKAEQLAAEGGRAAGSVAEAVSGADVVITMLPDSPDVEQVVTGADGVLDHARPGTLLIDMSTIRPDVSRDIAEAAARLRVLDAPVSGGRTGAVDGTLSVMVGGAAADFEAAQPVFDVLAKTVVHVGPHGAGQVVKAANQLIVGTHLQVLAEAIVLLEKSGVDLVPALQAIGGGLAGSTVLERKSSSMVAHEFEPAFRLELHHKDFGIITSAAREAGAFTPVGAVVAQLFAAAVARGDGGLDHSAVLKLVAEMS